MSAIGINLPSSNDAVASYIGTRVIKSHRDRGPCTGQTCYPLRRPVFRPPEIPGSESGVDADTRAEADGEIPPRSTDPTRSSRGGHMNASLLAHEKRWIHSAVRSDGLVQPGTGIPSPLRPSACEAGGPGKPPGGSGLRGSSGQGTGASKGFLGLPRASPAILAGFRGLGQCCPSGIRRKSQAGSASWWLCPCPGAEWGGGPAMVRPMVGSACGACAWRSGSLDGLKPGGHAELDAPAAFPELGDGVEVCLRVGGGRGHVIQPG